MHIRWRLTLWFSVILCAILVLTGVAVHTILQRHLYDDVDDHLRLHTASGQSLVTTTATASDAPGLEDYDALCACVPDLDNFGSPGVYVRLIDRDIGVIGRSSNFGELTVPVDPFLLEAGYVDEAGPTTVAASDGTRIRLMAAPVYIGGTKLVLEVGQSLEHIDSAMSGVRWALFASIMVALTLAVVSGGVLIRRALSTVSSITDTAQSIESSSDLSQRVSYSGPMDEIGKLATTFDHMIGHLEKVLESHKHFVADASHDLRSPLTVLRGNLDLLKRDLKEEDRKESLRAMEAEVGRMSKIVEDLLLLAEVESGQVEREKTVPLREVLVESCERGRQLGGSRKITIGHQDSVSVIGDAHRLNRLLGNLVDNAIRYTPEEGTITLSLFRENGWARIEVTDDGIGIDPEHLPHVFERFHMADKARSRSAGGSGLGLAIVRAIAEQHGGKVTATSEPGRGSTFTTWLEV